MTIDIDFDQIQEKEALSTKQSYTFSFKEVSPITLSEAGNPMIVVDFIPEGYPEDGFRHWFTLTAKALAYPSPTSSLRKFLEVLGYPGVKATGEVGQPLRLITRDGNEVLLKYLRFRGTVRHEKREGSDFPNVRLDRVEGAA